MSIWTGVDVSQCFLRLAAARERRQRMTQRVTQPLIVALLISQCLVYGLGPQAFGQNVLVLDEDASLCAIFQALSAETSSRCQGRFRSIVLRPTPSAPESLLAKLDPPPAQPAHAPATRPRVYAFATRIQFAWDSAQLARGSHRLLDTLAEVLKDAVMVDKIVQIEGHTDSAGSDAYNKRLSYHCAVAVQRYLHDYHGIPLQRIPAVGKGKSALYDPDRPLHPVNRRVQFVNLPDSTGRP